MITARLLDHIVDQLHVAVVQRLLERSDVTLLVHVALSDVIRGEAQLVRHVFDDVLDDVDALQRACEGSG